MIWKTNGVEMGNSDLANCCGSAFFDVKGINRAFFQKNIIMLTVRIKLIQLFSPLIMIQFLFSYKLICSFNFNFWWCCNHKPSFSVWVFSHKKFLNKCCCNSTDEFSLCPVFIPEEKDLGFAENFVMNYQLELYLVPEIFHLGGIEYYFHWG